MRGAWDFAEVDALGERFQALRRLPTTDTVCRAAVSAITRLAETAPGPGYHKVAWADALIAATAEDRGVGVLHYDRHFDRLAQVIHFESRWIAPVGTL